MVEGQPRHEVQILVAFEGEQEHLNKENMTNILIINLKLSYNTTHQKLIEHNYKNHIVKYLKPKV